MKFIIALCLVGVALGLPQRGRQQERAKQLVAPRADGDYIKIIRSDVSPIDGANFRYSYETENGIKAEKEGITGSEGQSNMAGSFSFPLEDGSIAEFRYVADENGYQPESSLLPVDHPIPPHALDQIRFAAEQRAKGVEWDIRGFQI